MSTIRTQCIWTFGNLLQSMLSPVLENSGATDEVICKLLLKGKSMRQQQHAKMAWISMMVKRLTGH